MSRHLDDLFAALPTHLSVVQLSSVLGVTKKTAYEYLQVGDVPAYRIGTKWVILRDEVRDFMLASSTTPPRTKVGPETPDTSSTTGA
jgi:excisionase family DNA binding protein